MAKTPQDFDGHDDDLTRENGHPSMPFPRPSSWFTELENRVCRLELTLREYHAPAVRDETGGNRVMTQLAEASSPTPSIASSDRVLVLASSPEQPLPPQGTVLHPPETPGAPRQRGWFVTQLIAEFRIALRMYFDPRYRISRTTQFVLPGIVVLVIVNYFAFAFWINIPVIAPIFERLVDVLLCIVGYKLLIWEIDRYRDVLDYLSQHGRR